MWGSEEVAALLTATGSWWQILRLLASNCFVQTPSRLHPHPHHRFLPECPRDVRMTNYSLPVWFCGPVYLAGPVEAKAVERRSHLEAFHRVRPYRPFKLKVYSLALNFTGMETTLRGCTNRGTD